MIEVKQDDKRGKYVVTSMPVSEGETIVNFSGEVINYQKTLELDEQESFALQVGIDRYIYLQPPYRFFNHSCDPNCGLTPSQVLVAIKDISKGEELTYDYSTTMLERHWQMSCQCKTIKCRGIVEDFDRLPVELQQFYLRTNVVQDFIKKTIDPAKPCNKTSSLLNQKQKK